VSYLDATNRLWKIRMPSNKNDWPANDIVEFPQLFWSDFIVPIASKIRDLNKAYSEKLLSVEKPFLEEKEWLESDIIIAEKIIDEGPDGAKASGEPISLDKITELRDSCVKRNIISKSQADSLNADYRNWRELLAESLSPSTRFPRPLHEVRSENCLKQVFQPLLEGWLLWALFIVPVLLVGGFLSLFFDFAKAVTTFLVLGFVLFLMLGASIPCVMRKRSLSVSEERAHEAYKKYRRRALAIAEAFKDSARRLQDDLLEKEQEIEELKKAQTLAMHEIEDHIRVRLLEYRNELGQKERQGGFALADWESVIWADWEAFKQSPKWVQVGTFHSFELASLFEYQDGFDVSAPAVLEFPTGLPIVFYPIDSEGHKRAISAAQSIVARLLATTPPGRLLITFIDPVGLGQNAARFMRLGDYDELLITGRAWSDSRHIDKRMQDLTEHVENVIQKYLRHEFGTIADYNLQANEIAEPYRLLMVFDFPSGFSETAKRSLTSLIRSGPRCGVFPIIVCDPGVAMPFQDPREMQSTVWNVRQKSEGGEWWMLDENVDQLKGDGLGGVAGSWFLKLLNPAPQETLDKIVKSVGDLAIANKTVVVPYSKVLSFAGLDPDHAEGRGKRAGLGDAPEVSSAECVEIPLGPMGARKTQVLTLGKGTAHHVLIAGRTGSGKSNLLHVIITTLAVKYSPREVELYLIDFKKGVEFKPYANHALPHARVIAIESEREFGLSVLQGLDTEMQRRGEVFRGMEANDLAEYRQKTDSPLARLILIVDEFQEFFSEDDAIGRQAAGILDRLVRQGRSFGIHVILGSQSLAGSYSLARSTLDQMQIRIALPCSEADSRLILADDNPAARLLSRPGEAIYNAASGLVEGNQIFQVARFSDDDRQHYLQALARKGEGLRRPIVFEGHEPAALEACVPLAALLAAPGWPVAGKGSEVWLGEAVAMKPPTSVRFRRQGGANLLVLTREEEQGVGLLAACTCWGWPRSTIRTACASTWWTLPRPMRLGRISPATWRTCCRTGSRYSGGVIFRGC
jgi:DNA segregation ATPase FtsK/SpoIIIE, S-DNA-T family